LFKFSKLCRLPSGILHLKKNLAHSRWQNRSSLYACVFFKAALNEVDVTYSKYKTTMFL